MVGPTTSLGTRMTRERIRALCKKNDLYLNASLNEVLYLHFQGFDEIACLEDYTQLKCLWLDSNAIPLIQGLDNQPHLKCLFLQNNLIRRIENLSNCPQLDTLNLSHNQLRSVDNCRAAILPALTSLDLSHNYLRSADQLAELQDCDALSVLDLSHNRIDDELVVKLLAAMSSLRVLTLNGNPVISLIPNYRKTMILECKSLTYLDNRPVTERDRACAEAWKRGGYAAEREEQERWIKAANRKTKEDINRLLQKRNDRGHQPPFKLLNVVSEDDLEAKEGNSGQYGLNNQGEDLVDNLQSWRNVETILANPESYQTSTDYLSQFTDDMKKEHDPGLEESLHFKEAQHFDIIGPKSSASDFKHTTTSEDSQAAAEGILSTSEESPPQQSHAQESASLQHEDIPASQSITQAVASSSASSSIFPSFVRVTYPDPATNQFPSERPPIGVAPKYATISDTKKSRDCPDVEPLFVDQPLARISIDYEAMRQMPSEYDEMVEEGVQQLAAAEEESLRNYASYLGEVDRIYNECMQPKTQRSVTAGAEENRASEEDKQRDKETFSLDGRINLLGDLDKLFEFNNYDPQVRRDEKVEDKGEEKLTVLHHLLASSAEKEMYEIRPKTFSSSTVVVSPQSTEVDAESPVLSTTVIAANANLPPLKDPHYTNLSDLASDAAAIDNPGQVLLRGALDWDEDAAWFRAFLNDTDNCQDLAQLSEMTGTIRQLSKERMAKIREENRRIVDSIKRLYEDKPVINRMRRHLGDKSFLIDSQAINETMTEASSSGILDCGPLLPLPVVASTSSSTSYLTLSSTERRRTTMEELTSSDDEQEIGQVDENLSYESEDEEDN